MAETITLNKVYDELKKIEKSMATKKLLSDYLETFGILSNPETMQSIRKSREDIKTGRVEKISSVQDMLKDM